MVAMQAATLLQNTYVIQANGQLNAHEDKLSKKKKKKKKLTGCAQLLMGDTFFNMVVEAEKNAAWAVQEKEERKGRREEQVVAIATWKKHEKRRKERNEEIRGQYRVAVEKWETERNRVKAACQKPAWKKPKMGPIEKGIPRPKIPDTEESEEEEENRGIELDEDMHDN